MFRSCILGLIFYLLLLVAYSSLLATAVEAPASYVIGAVVALFVWAAIGSVLSVRTLFRDWRLLSMASHGGSPQDGQWVAVAGTIHPLEGALKSPFGQDPCVICEYDIARPEQDRDREGKTKQGFDYGGFLMTPSVIRTPQGDVRLLGFPILEGFVDCKHDSCDAALHAVEFLSNHEFEDRSGIRIVSMFSLFGELWSDDDGCVEKNVRFSHAKVDELFPADLLSEMERRLGIEPDGGNDASRADSQDELGSEGEWEDDVEPEHSADEVGDELSEKESVARPRLPRMRELTVPVGIQVCAMGHYDAARRGLCPPPKSNAPNRLLLGSAEENASKTRRSMARRFIGGLIVLCVVHAILYGVMRTQRVVHQADAGSWTPQDAKRR